MKKRLLALFLCAAILLLSACQGSTENSSVPEEPPQESSSQSQEPPVSSGPEEMAVVPDDSSNLTVQLRLTSPEEEEGYPSGELGYSTQAEADACRQWLYSLQAGEITAMYGIDMPRDYYWTGDMSLEDSRRIVDLVRSIAPGLAPLEKGNPPTGGGWSVAIHTGDEAVGLGFNGEWVTFTRDGKGWILDGTSPSVLESCYEIDALLGKYANVSAPPAVSPSPAPSAPAAPPAETYFPDNVQALYAVDKRSYTMAKIEDGTLRSQNIWREMERRTPADGAPSDYAYLLFTTEGREYVNLNDDEEDRSLNDYCKAALNDNSLHPSWLIHMTPEKMVSVNGMEFDDVVTDRDELLALAKFLKEEVTVRPKTSSVSGPVNPDMPAGVFVFTIAFDSGVKYEIIGYNGERSLSIYTSDLDRTVGYALDNGVDNRIANFLERYGYENLLKS